MPQHRGRTYKNMTNSALGIMATIGRNIKHAHCLCKIELRNLTGTNMPERYQTYDVMAHLFVHDVVAFNTIKQEVGYG
jgi:hypothetical protein